MSPSYSITSLGCRDPSIMSHVAGSSLRALDLQPCSCVRPPHCYSTTSEMSILI